MIRSSVVTLIQPVPEAHGIYDTPAAGGRTVPCDVMSVTRREHYDALSHGIHPEWVLLLGDYAEYHDELFCTFEGRQYKIVRTYTRGDRRIELTIERMTAHDI